MRPIIPLLSICLLMAAIPCQAAKWRMIATSADTGATVSVDDATLEARDYIAGGWVRIDYMAPRVRDGVTVSAYAAKWQANCNNHRYWVSEAYGYPPNAAEPVRLYSTAQEWRAPVPDSEDEFALDALCEETRSLFGQLVEKIGNAIGNMRGE